MSFGSLLLRVMLIMAFVLNGTTSAMAAAQMSLGDSMPPRQTVQHAAEPGHHHENKPACHHEGMGKHEATAAAHGHAPHSVTSKHQGHSSDCCGSSGSCPCVCAHGMHATVPALVLALHVYGRSDEPDSPTTGHAAPALQHLIRPPIG